MRLRNAIFAIAVAAVALAAAPAEALELHGYFRSGLGGNSTGGGQTCFALMQFGYKFRLGNECETYGELQFDETLYRDRTGIEFKFSSMLTFQTAQRRTYDSLRIDSDYNDIALRQLWIGAKIPQLGDTTWWVGNRYYKRKDLHEIDLFFWDPSGYGVGVEDIDLGFAKLAVAVMSTPEDLLKAGEGVYNSPPPYAGTQKRAQIWRPDIRLYGIPFPGGGSVEVGVDLFITSNNVRSGVLTPANIQIVSPWVSAMHRQPNILGGDNMLALQWATGSAAPMNAFPQYGNSSNSMQFRILDYFIINPIPEFSNHFVFAYHNIDQRYGGTSGDFNNAHLWAAGIRPAYHVTDWFKIQGDFGWQLVVPKQANADGVEGNRSLTKLTLAPTIVAGRGAFSRPELRLFVTYAFWNTAAQQRNVGGMNSWGVCDAANTNSPWGCDKSGLTFGAQMEAWW
jgi:maltoporin